MKKKFRLDIYYAPLNHQIATLYFDYAQDLIKAMDTAQFQDEFRITDIDCKCYQYTGTVSWKKIGVAEICYLYNEEIDGVCLLDTLNGLD